MVPSEVQIPCRHQERNYTTGGSIPGNYLTANHLLSEYNFLQNRDESNKRDYLYYLAIGNTKLKEYATALKYVRALLQVEPGNRQAQELEAIVTKKLEKDGMIGMAVAGGTAVALGGLVGLGLALAGRQMMKK